MTPGPPWVVLLLVALALVVWSPVPSLARRRVRSLGSVDAPGAGPGATRDSTRDRAAVLRRRLPAVSAAAAAALVVGGAWAVPAAVVAGVVADRSLRRQIDREVEARRRRAVSRELPAACELLAVCLAAGVPVGAALAAVAGATTGPLAAELGTVAALDRLGAPPRRAWGDALPDLAPLGRILVRAEESGSAVAAALHALARDARAADRAETEAAVARAGIWLLLPLGTCFLPAFVCLGVVPLVLGIAGHVFG